MYRDPLARPMVYDLCWNGPWSDIRNYPWSVIRNGPWSVFQEWSMMVYVIRNGPWSVLLGTIHGLCN